MGPVSICVEVQRNTDGDTPSSQIGAAYSSLGRTNVYVLYATSLVCLGAKAKLRRRKPNVLVALDEISEMC